MDEKKIADDEISLVDILKKIWQYRRFIIIFCIIGILLSFSFLYFSEKSKVSKLSKENFQYFKIIFPSISYGLYDNLKKQIEYDILSGLFFKEFNLELKTTDIDYFVFNENGQKIYKPNDKDFPKNVLGIKIINKSKKPFDENKLKEYIYNYILYFYFNDNLSQLKNSYISLKQSRIENQVESLSDVFLFFNDLYENLNTIYLKNKMNLDANYIEFSSYVKHLNITDSLINRAKSLLLEMIDNDYNLVKTNKNISLEKIENNLSVMSIIKKEIIIAFGLAFFAIFLVFVIDFFKKNWKEIVK